MGLYIERMDLSEPKPILAHPKKRMNWGLRPLLVFVLAGTLATSALACPLWMGSMSQQEMPCSDHSDPGGRCPFSICQVSSPYLASYVSVDTPPLQALLVEAVDWAILWPSSANADSIRRDDGAPPGLSGELFLRFHSFLI